LSLDASPAVQYQVACIYALMCRQEGEDRDHAVRLLAAALRGGYGGELIASDKDLDPIRSCRQFQELLQALRSLHPAATEPRTVGVSQPSADRSH
jgi:hypothetical protein